MTKWLKIWRILLILGAVLGVFFILAKYLALDGKLVLKYDFSHAPDLISLITPAGRASDRSMNLQTRETYQIISGDPTYFTVTVPRSFSTAEVSIDYTNPEQNILELGLQKGAGWNFELKPLENKFIDASTWERTDDDALILLQKNPTYSSVDDFIANLPKDKNIATYNYALPYSFKIEDYQPSNNSLEISTALRGKHVFYTYLKNETLDFTFKFKDLNSAFNVDDFKLQVTNGKGTEILEDFLPDDGDVIADGKIYGVRTKNIQLTDLPEGIYIITLDVTDDIITEAISTKQHLLVAQNNIFLANNASYEEPEALQKIMTNCDALLFRTSHAENLQTAFIQSQPLDINSINKWFTWEDPNSALGSLKKIEVSKGDLQVQGAGYFSFTPESWFDPDFGISKLSNTTDLNFFDYLIAANYSAPVEAQRFKTATQQFNLDYVPGDRKTLNFVISAPGLADTNADILIKEIRVALYRESIWEKIKAYFK